VPLKKILVKIFLLPLILPALSPAQELISYSNNYGFNISLNVAFGTHFQRLGLNLNFYYTNTHFQANSELRAYFSFKNLGPRFINPELVLAQGLVFAYGKTDQVFNPFLNSVSNQTGYSNSVAYSYNAYFNKRKTTQQTGIVAFQFDKIAVITENDILARTMLDRFRTAAFLIHYQYEDKFQAAINCSMWTGSMGNRTSSERPEFYSGCYMDTTHGQYANTSHGLLSAQIKYNVAYSQNAQLNCGVDAEQIRNAVQNRFIHDMPLIPKKWKQAKNCHIPMLDKNGNQYLYKPDQKIRNPKVYLNVFSNANVFY
jgi:hypothetical protein